MFSESRYGISSSKHLRSEKKSSTAPSLLSPQQRWRNGVFFLHGTGFLTRTYTSFLRELAPLRLRYVPILGMQEDKVVAEDWKDLIQQTMSHIPLGASHLVGLGHSLGALLMLEAYYLRPKAFSYLVLMDPPIFTWTRQWPIRFFRFFGQTELAIIQAKRAKRRRDFWRTKEEARAYLSSKSFFSRFHPNALEDYINYGLRKSIEGYELRIPRDLEYTIFCSTPARLKFMRIDVPTYVLYSAEYEVCRREDVRYIARHLPDARIVPVAGGHMFPIEQPVETAELIRSLIP